MKKDLGKKVKEMNANIGKELVETLKREKIEKLTRVEPTKK